MATMSLREATSGVNFGNINASFRLLNEIGDAEGSIGISSGFKRQSRTSATKFFKAVSHPLPYD